MSDTKRALDQTEAIVDQLVDENKRLQSILITIQELATDTPTKRDMEMALNGIVRLCEDALSSCESYP